MTSNNPTTDTAALADEAAFLVALAEHGLPPWVGEQLVQGIPEMGVPPGGLRKALSALRSVDRNQVMEEVAAWHDTKAAVAHTKHNPRLNVTALVVARVHEDSAQAIRSLKSPPASEPKP